jgi:NADH dehydrogenase (ubiquinone) 1 alpha subcomplex subunit 5
MFRLTPVLLQVVKKTTGITGLAVHPDPLPALSNTYQSTLSLLSSIPPTSIYRQGVEALTQRKLSVVQGANGDIAAVERELDEGQIEESLDIATDELNLASKMIEWKACVASYTTFGQG